MDKYLLKRKKDGNDGTGTVGETRNSAEGEGPSQKKQNLSVPVVPVLPNESQPENSRRCADSTVGEY